MPSLLKALGLLMVCTAAQAGTAPILLEACNLFDERDKRLACLRAANGLGADAPATHPGTSRGSGPATVPAAMPHALGSFDGTAAAARSSGPSGARHVSGSGNGNGNGVRSPARASGGATCYTGPRGGTYTITASGRKNYGGC